MKTKVLKPSFKYNFKLNFAISNKDNDIKKRNLHIYKTSLFTMFLFCVVLIPFFVYLFIVNNNVNLDFYFKNYDDMSVLMDLPSQTLILGTMWSGLVVFMVSIAMLLLFKPIVTMKKINRDYQMLYILVTIVILITTLLLGAISQYNYSLFEDFFIYESMTTYVKFGIFQEVSVFFTENFINNIDVYRWQTSEHVWWIMFIQTTVIFGLGLSLQNSVFGKSQIEGLDRYIEYKSGNKQNIEISKYKIFINKIFKREDKVLSYWSIGIVLLILIPQVVYAGLISANTSTVGSMLNWIYKMPNLVQDAGPDHVGEINRIMNENFGHIGSVFSISSLPIVFVGIALAIVFFFTAISFRGKNIMTKLFISQYIILFVSLLIVIVVITVSKVQIFHLSEIWTKTDGDSFVGKNIIKEIEAIVNLPSNIESTATGDFENLLKELYDLNGIDDINSKFNYAGLGVIAAEAIVHISVAIMGFVLIGSEVIKSLDVKWDYEKRLTFLKQSKEKESDQDVE